MSYSRESSTDLVKNDRFLDLRPDNTIILLRGEAEALEQLTKWKRGHKLFGKNTWVEVPLDQIEEWNFPK